MTLPPVAIAAEVSALSQAEAPGVVRFKLDAVTVAALGAELAATLGSHQTYRQTGVAEALDGGWGRVEDWGATQLGVVAPLALHGAAALLSRRNSGTRRVGDMSSLASLAGLAQSLLLRVSVLGAGDELARRPEVSFRFSQPEHQGSE